MSRTLAGQSLIPAPCSGEGAVGALEGLSVDGHVAHFAVAFARRRGHQGAVEPLCNQTPDAWLGVALSDLGALLIDHAHCEKKAAAHAITLVNQYPEQSAIVTPLINLAQEELRHFRQVFALLEARGLTLTIDRGDPYVKGLMGAARHSRLERLVDRLLIASLVEARSAERLQLLGDGLSADGSADGTLGPFYSRLARAEAGHHRLFVRLAKKIAPDDDVKARLAHLAAIEAEVMLAQPLAPRIH